MSSLDCTIFNIIKGFNRVSLFCTDRAPILLLLAKKLRGKKKKLEVNNLLVEVICVLMEYRDFRYNWRSVLLVEDIIPIGGTKKRMSFDILDASF